MTCQHWLDIYIVLHENRLASVVKMGGVREWVGRHLSTLKLGC